LVSYISKSLRRHRLFLFGAPSALVFVVFACGTESPKFILVPDASEETEQPGTETDAEPGGGGDDAGTIDDASVVDAPDYDALIVDDPGEPVDASGCTSCDCDGDGFPRKGCGDAGEGVPTDCNDDDTRYRPNQGFVTARPEPGRSGDWNCDGRVEKLYPTNVKCSLLALTGCNGSHGFEGDPGCGEEGKFIHCKAPIGLLLCTVGKTETRRQACR